MRRRINQLTLTYMLILVDKDIKTVTVKVFRVFKTLEKKTEHVETWKL